MMISLPILLTPGGIFFFFVSLYFFIRLVVALKSKCDFQTAITPSPPPMAYANHVIWITGASSGIGRELARQLSVHGAKLILSSRRNEALNKVADECRGINCDVSATVLPLDLEQLDTLPQKAEEALAIHGRIDVLINSGGVTTRATARDSSFDVDVMVMKVDFLSHVCITKCLLPSMTDDDGKKKNGKNKTIIINLSSVAGKMGLPVRTSYCGAKHALLGFYDALRLEEAMRSSKKRRSSSSSGSNKVTILNVVLGSTRTNAAYNAIVRTPTDIFGQVDANIEKGLHVEFVAERILASAYVGRKEIWICPHKELPILYINQYVPDLAKKILKKASKEYAVERKKKEQEKKDD